MTANHRRGHLWWYQGRVLPRKCRNLRFYAAQIARDWNVKDSGAGFVTRFAVLAAYLSNFAVQKVGALEHTEYWIPAEELATFNENIVGLIEIIQEFGGAPNAQ